MKKAFRLLYSLLFLCCQLLTLGVARGQVGAYIKLLLRAVFRGVSHTVASLENFIDVANRSDCDNLLGSYNEKQIEKSRQLIKGWHSLLPKDPLYTYSCLVVANHSQARHFEEALRSALVQTAPFFEVIVGFNTIPDKKVEAIFTDLQDKYPHILKRLDRIGLESDLLNALALKASGNILVFFEQDGWMRSDLLFRFEQIFRILPYPEKKVIYTEEVAKEQPDRQFPFPYVFDMRVPGCFAIPRSLWNAVGGMRKEFDGAHMYDLFLRLDLVQAEMQGTPTRLYKRRGHGVLDSSKGASSFVDYLGCKNLDWKVTNGYLPYTLRAIPSVVEKPEIEAIVPFKDHKEMTLAALRTLQKQKGINLKITAIDNGSVDLSIGKECEKLGIEVIRIDEPFNFSRLNNIAAKRSSAAFLFFMNNDVELSGDEDLLEMSRWVGQSGIGMVGCRLHYPNGLLQHGGVDIDKREPAYKISFKHTESQKTFEDLDVSKTLRIVDCVTGAAILIRRELFLQVEGFDEIWYPNGGSDTNLAMKLKKLGQASFYTPYASGIHRESISRISSGFLEEYDNLTLMHDYHQAYITRMERESCHLRS